MSSEVISPREEKEILSPDQVYDQVYNQHPWRRSRHDLPNVHRRNSRETFVYGLGWRFGEEELVEKYLPGVPAGATRTYMLAKMQTEWDNLDIRKKFGSRCLVNTRRQPGPRQQTQQILVYITTNHTDTALKLAENDDYIRAAMQAASQSTEPEWFCFSDPMLIRVRAV